ncbi:MAG TPA: ATP-binding protein, partial [Myxococcota bacterium]|nr:ATP-binding protein [Myxococcota bacterium]
YPTQRGLVVLDPAVLAEPPAPEVVLGEVWIAGRTYVSGDRLQVERARTELSVAWLAPASRFAEQVRFQYRLAGAESAWHGPITARSASWRELPAGEFTVEVRSTLGGAWSSPTPILWVRREPRWYETRLIWLAIGVAGAASFGVGALLSAIAQARRRALLDDEVRRRTEQLNAANLRLDAQNVALTRQAAELSASSRQVEEQSARLADQARRLADADAARSRLVTNLSHELRTPLTLLLSPLDELRAAAAPAAAASLDLMWRNGERVRELVDQLFDVARLDAGHLRLRARRVDLWPFVRGVAERFRAWTEPRRQTLRLDLPAEPVVAWIDPDLIDKVLTNLLGNACRFAEEGGAVSVTARVSGDEPVVRVEVGDSGPGVPAALRERVFERFFQGDDDDTSQRGGAGIGLSLARELVELHGGRIGVDGGVDRGSTFWFEVPTGASSLSLDEVDLRAAAGRPPSRPAAGEGALVLIVEDHAELRAYLAEHLGRALRVVEAEDGERGLALAAALRPDVIVSDVMMPRMDGLALARALRADPELAATPIVLVSAKAGPADVEAARGL